MSLKNYVIWWTARRIYSQNRNRILPAVFVTGLLAFSFTTASELSDTEAHGKQIYLTGTSPDGSPITAFLGVDQVKLPASVVPCGSCHGIDGRGRPEGGVVPSDITWSELSKGYGHEHDFDRRHPAFDENSLAVSIIGGTDSAGNKLNVAMPRYHMKPDDIEALVAYLKRIEDDLDPGINEHAVTVGTLLPLTGSAASQGHAVRAVLMAFIREINAGGGVNGRRVELEVIPLGASSAETVANVQAAISSPGLFAMVAAYIPGTDTQLLALLADMKIPVVGPLSRTPDVASDRLQQAFYLYSGTPELMQSLARFALTDVSAEQDRQVVVGPDSELLRKFSEQLVAQGNRPTVTLPYARNKFEPATTMALLNDTDDVFFLGSAAELDGLIAALAGSKTWPRVFLPAAAVSRQMLHAAVEFDDRIFIAFPTQPSDVNDGGRELFARLAANEELPATQIASQVSAVAAAKILVEAMQAAGHALSRERLVAELEGMHGYVTGLTPPVSFGLNRRIGARGAHIVRVDLSSGLLIPAAAWANLP